MFAQSSISQPRNLESIYGPFRRTVVPTAKARSAETNMIDFYPLPPSQVLPEMIEDSETPSRAMMALDPYLRWTDGLTESRLRRDYLPVYLDDKPWYAENFGINSNFSEPVAKPFRRGSELFRRGSEPCREGSELFRSFYSDLTSLSLRSEAHVSEVPTWVHISKRT